MSVNKHLPHVLVLPEDDANRQLANGFVLGLAASAVRRVQVLPEAGGWLSVLELFESDHVADMGRYPNRHVVLLIDFDRKVERRGEAAGRVPENLRDRVFIIGAWSEPEDLRRATLGSYETIGRGGRGAARDCQDATNHTWNHDLLQHNADEIARLRAKVRVILFEP